MRFEEFTMEAIWERYRQDCIPKEAEQWQVDVVKQAYFSGAYVLFNVLKKIAEQRSPARGNEIATMIEGQLEQYMREQTKRTGQKLM